MASMALTGTSPFDGGQGIHFGPEVDRVAQVAFGDLAQPLMLLAEHEGPAPGAQSFRDSPPEWNRRYLCG